MPTHTLTEKVIVGGTTISKTHTHTAGAEHNIDESIPDSQTDYQVAFSLDVSEIASLFIVSDQDITLETNSGSSPDNTLNLKAGEPYIWHENSLDACLLTVDITALYVTNSSGSAANLQIMALYDPTP